MGITVGEMLRQHPRNTDTWGIRGQDEEITPCDMKITALIQSIGFGTLLSSLLFPASIYEPKIFGIAFGCTFAVITPLAIKSHFKLIQTGTYESFIESWKVSRGADTTLTKTKQIFLMLILAPFSVGSVTIPIFLKEAREIHAIIMGYFFGLIAAVYTSNVAIDVWQWYKEKRQFARQITYESFGDEI